MNLIAQEPQSPSEYRIIPLTQGYCTIIDEADYAKLPAGRKWYAIRMGRRIYAHNSRIGLLHRIILGLTDSRIRVDHKDRDGLNNRRSNLRIATPRQNQANIPKIRGKSSYPYHSQYKGVSRKGTVWLARIGGTNDTKHLGTFRSEEAAARAYDAAAIELYGEFACFNFPSSREREEK